MAVHVDLYGKNDSSIISLSARPCFFTKCIFGNLYSIFSNSYLCWSVRKKMIRQLYRYPHDHAFTETASSSAIYKVFLAIVIVRGLSVNAYSKGSLYCLQSTIILIRHVIVVTEVHEFQDHTVSVSRDMTENAYTCKGLLGAHTCAVQPVRL